MIELSPNQIPEDLKKYFRPKRKYGPYILRNEIVWHKPNCLNGKTILYAKTQKGTMPSTLKDLVRLKPSTVKLWDGENWQQVKEWNKNPNPQDIKEITFRNGEVIKCTGEHLFPLLNNDIKKANELKVGDIIKNTSLPSEIKDIRYIPDEIGWLIGTYLADGSIGDKGRCLQYSSNINEQDRFNKLKKIAEKYDARCYSFNEGNSATFNIYSKILIAIIKTYVGGKSAKDKHLTNKVWQRNNAFLDNILKGYLSGDGYYEKENNRYRLCFTRNEYLARDLRLLCARLGYYIKLQKRVMSLKNKIFKKYSGEIRLIISNHFNIKSGYEIINIKNGKKIGYFWDIVLEKEPHVFASHSGLLIHNCMPASVKDRFTVDFEKIFFFVKNRKYWFEQQFEEFSDSTIPRMFRGVSQNNKWIDGPCGQSKHNMSQPRENETKYFNKNYGGSGTGFKGHSGYKRSDGKLLINPKGRNKRSVWTISTKPFSEAHFAVFPEELCVTPIKAGCPEGGTVLDPFAGAGTTAVVARKLSRKFIGIELNPEYIKIAEKRLAQETLF